MRRAALAALLAHWRRAPLQLLALLGGLMLATALWSAVQVINAEARASYAQAAGVLGQGRPARLVARDGGTLAEADLATLARAGWRVSPLVEGEVAGRNLIGIDPLTAPSDMAPVAAGAGAGALAAFILPPGEVHAREALPGLPAVVDALVAPGVAVADIGIAQTLLGMEGRLSAILLAPEAEQPLGRAPLEQVAPHLRPVAAGPGVDLAGLTRSFHLNLTAFGFLAFAVGLFIVQGAVALAFAQRRGTIRVLRCLGLDLRHVMALLAAELLLAALLAGAAGVALGQGVAVLLMPDVARSLDALYGAGVASVPGLRPGVWLAALGMGIAGTAVAGAGALWQAARLPVLADPLRPAPRPGRWLLPALGLLAAAAVLAVRAQGMGAAIALLVCLMGGGALALPVLLAAVLRGLARLARGPFAGWFWADAARALPDLRLALMALLLAMATNVGVTTMVSSFRLAFEAFLDQRLVADLQVTLPPDADAAAVEAWAAAGGAQVLPRLATGTTIAGLPAELQGLRDAPAYRSGWRLLAGRPDAWDRLARGTGVLVSEQLANRAGLGVGDVIDLGAGDDARLEIVGIHADYGNPLGQASIGEALFRRLHPGVAPGRLGLVLPAGADPGAVAAGLRAEFGLAGDEIAARAAIRAASLAVFERTFAVTAALSVLTLAVAGFALLMSLATLATMRLPQVAPLWAMGVGRRALALAELGRALGLAALTGVLALPLGLALAWALLAVVNVAAFGWRLPLFLFPADWARLLGLALVAAALAGLVPALGLWRAGPARLLRVFADDR